MALLNRVNKAYKVRAKRRRVSITVADLTATALSQSIDIGAALPAGAIVVGSYLDVTAVFTGGGSSSCVADLGVKGADTDSLLAGVDIFAGVAKKGLPAGVLPAGFYGAITPAILITADVNVVLLTTGAMTVNILYIDAEQGDVNG